MTAIAKDAPRDRLPYLFSAGHMCIDWPFGAAYLIVPAAGVTFGWTPAQVGTVLTVQSVVASMAYVPAGLLTDRLAERGRILALTFLWVVVGYAFASTADSLWALAALMALASIGDAAWHPMATGILMKSSPTGRGRILGIHAIGGTLAGVFAPLMAGFLLEQVDWRTTLQWVLIPTAAMGLFFLFYVGPRVPRVAPDQVQRPSLKAILRDWWTPFGICLALMMMVFNLGVIGATAMAPLYLRDVHALDAFSVGLIFSGAVLVGALLQPRVGHLSDTIGRWPTIGAGALFGGAGAVTLFLAEDFSIAVTGLVLCIGALNAVRSCILACAVDLSGKGESTTLAIAFAVLDGVGAFGAVLAGTLGAVDIKQAFLLTIGCSAVSILLVMLLSRLSHASATAR